MPLPPNPPPIPQLLQTKANQAQNMMARIRRPLGVLGAMQVHPNGRRYMDFTDNNGAITCRIEEKKLNAIRPADIAIILTEFSRLQQQHNAGDALEDPYPSKNSAGSDIVVQRYQKGGVCWDGQNAPFAFTWHDWHTVAGPNHVGNGPPPPPPPPSPLPHRLAMAIGYITFAIVIIRLLLFLSQ